MHRRSYSSCCIENNDDIESWNHDIDMRLVKLIKALYNYSIAFVPILVRSDYDIKCPFLEKKC